MNQKRIQLTLFLPEPDAATIEAIRRQYNLEQVALIRAHITLCREDELEPIERVVANLATLRSDPVEVQFGPVVRFSDGQGVLIPAAGDNDAFQQLRKQVLRGVVDVPRRHEPHITLMHPRNSLCTDAIFAQIEQFALPRSIRLNRISLIEQEAGQPWKVLQELELGNADPEVQPHN